MAAFSGNRGRSCDDGRLGTTPAVTRRVDATNLKPDEAHWGAIRNFGGASWAFKVEDVAIRGLVRSRGETHPSLGHRPLFRASDACALMAPARRRRSERASGQAVNVRFVQSSSSPDSRASPCSLPSVSPHSRRALRQPAHVSGYNDFACLVSTLLFPHSLIGHATPESYAPPAYPESSSGRELTQTEALSQYAVERFFRR
jgi:hypothetical protein